jgi:hypothetical protein
MCQILKILDVGPGEGTYSTLLNRVSNRCYRNMEPYIENIHLEKI